MFFVSGGLSYYSFGVANREAGGRQNFFVGLQIPIRRLI
jgi:hypothetical protein